MTPHAMLMTGCIWTTASVAWTGGSIALLVRHSRRMQRACVAQGVVVGTLKVELEGQPMYAPRIAYRVDDVAYESDGGTFYSTPNWTVGQTRSLLYEAGKPTAVIVPANDGTQSFGRAFLGIGLMLTLLGVFFIAAGILGPAHPTIRFLSQFFSAGE